MDNKKISLVNEYDWDVNSKGIKRINDKNFSTVKKALDAKGPGFCLAKWNQVTMHLGTGMTHSCHHPPTHKIPLEELKENPTALHNTKFKKEQRKAMLNGKRPAECEYCWRVEDEAVENNFSDRARKSLEDWALPHIDVIKDMDGSEDVLPTYLEVSFSNVCNLKCTYCGPESSSMWYEDIKQKGPIKLLEGTDNETWSHGWQENLQIFKKREQNPYVDAFWEWWPDLHKSLKVFRITGGEPLLSKDTFKVLEWIIEHPNPELELSINSNLSVPDKVWDRFIDLINRIKDTDNIKNITIYASVEGWGKRAEYARTNLDFNKFTQRYEQLVSMSNMRAIIMATYNIFSVTSFQKLLEWQLGLRQKYNKSGLPPIWETAASVGFKSKHNLDIEKNANWKFGKGDVLIGMDIPYLRDPKFLDARSISHDLVLDYMLPTLDFMADNQVESKYSSKSKGFSEHEIDKLARIVYHRIYFNQNNKTDPTEPDWVNRKDLDVSRAGFYEFVNTSDKRNNTDFLSTFPEMKEFYYECKESVVRLQTGIHGDTSG
jgi:organic radical activating enzyme|tara:strand:+ start:76 stop:1710 length:1635 start_codon:yes stop_codon:yes gene_type:complete